MPRYDVRCVQHGLHEIVASIKTAAEFMPCGECGLPSRQVFSPPCIVEDRLRFWKGPMGNGYSHALGAQMPETRAGRDRLAAEKGVEFCTIGELKADDKEIASAIDYRKDVDTGGKKIPMKEAIPASAWKDKPAWSPVK